MAQDFDTAEERARLAAADLMVAANDVIGRHTVGWKDAGDEVAAAQLSRWTRYLPSRKLDDAREFLEFGSRAGSEARSIAAARGAVAVGGSGDAGSAEAKSIVRLEVLATECERRAVYLRS